MTTVRENDDSTTRWYFVAVIILFAVISVPMAAMGAVAVWKGDSGAATVRTTTVDVELSEFAVSGSLAAAPGDVSLTITNKGTVAHNLIMTNGPRTASIQPGATTTLEFGRLAARTYEFYCDVPGHAGPGMRATLSVSSAAVGFAHRHLWWDLRP